MAQLVTRGRLVVGVVLVGVIAVAVVITTVVTRTGTHEQGRTQREACEQQAADHLALVDPPVDLHDTEESLVIDFGAGRGRRLDTVEVGTEIAMPAAWQDFEVILTNLSYRNQRELNGEALVVAAERVDRNTISVSLCIDPKVHGVKAGAYRGFVHVTDDRLEDIDIPVTVYAQDNRSWIWLWLALAGGILSSLVAYRIHGRPQRDLPANRNAQWLPLLFLITVGFGAAFYRAVSAYNEDRAWGSNAWDGLLLLAQTVPLGYGATVGVSDILKQLGSSWAVPADLTGADSRERQTPASEGDEPHQRAR